jgi:hypothetical protein
LWGGLFGAVLVYKHTKIALSNTFLRCVILHGTLVAFGGVRFVICYKLYVAQLHFKFDLLAPLAWDGLRYVLRPAGIPARLQSGICTRNVVIAVGGPWCGVGSGVGVGSYFFMTNYIIVRFGHTFLMCNYFLCNMIFFCCTCAMYVEGVGVGGVLSASIMFYIN